jgi:Nitrile hydratase, alpha chain
MTKVIDSEDGGSKYLAIIAMTVARAWKDPSYKARLIAHPETIIAEEGLSFPPNVKFRVLENTPTVRYLPLSRHLDLEKHAETLKGVLGNVLPIPLGTELRLVQSTENLRYLVIPEFPHNVSPDTTQNDLMAFAAADTVTTTQVAAVQTAAAVSTAAAATQVLAVTVAVAT